jgi:hypothetical protein
VILYSPGLPSFHSGILTSPSDYLTAFGDPLITFLQKQDYLTAFGDPLITFLQKQDYLTAFGEPLITFLQKHNISAHSLRSGL